MPLKFHFFKDINPQAKRGLKALFTISYNRTGKMQIQNYRSLWDGYNRWKNQALLTDNEKSSYSSFSYQNSEIGVFPKGQ